MHTYLLNFLWIAIIVAFFYFILKIKIKLPRFTSNNFDEKTMVDFYIKRLMIPYITLNFRHFYLDYSRCF